MVSARERGFFQRTVIGLALRAGASNPLGAAFVGIDNRRLGILRVRRRRACSAGCGGAVWSPISLAQVDIGIGLALKGFTAAALGGFADHLRPDRSAGSCSASPRASAPASSRRPIRTRSPSACCCSRCCCGRRGCSAAAPRTRPATSGRKRCCRRSRRGDHASRGAICVSSCWHRGRAGVAWDVAERHCGSPPPSSPGSPRIVVMGLVLLTGYGGQLSLGQGAFMMIGAYSSGYLTVNAGLAAARGDGGRHRARGARPRCCSAASIFRLRGYYLSMASLGPVDDRADFRARRSPASPAVRTACRHSAASRIGGFSFFADRQFYCAGAGDFAASCCFCAGLTRSRFGRALLAIRSNEMRGARLRRRCRRAQDARASPSAPACASVAGSLYVHYLEHRQSRRRSASTPPIAQLTALTPAVSCRCGAPMSAAAVVVAVAGLVIALDRRLDLGDAVRGRAAISDLRPAADRRRALAQANEHGFGALHAAKFRRAAPGRRASCRRLP